ncbi:MAG: DUF3703 domain-containing protein, partial [Actinomycetota bacterium]|nr:DUF3703 domain-containing protein [Actinomycetota bacterium]
EVDLRLTAAREARRAGHIATAWTLLEDAHVLSQPLAVAHVRVHLAMFAVGLRLHDWREVVGQAARLVVAAPGSWTRKYPVGNTGRADVPATRPMPIRTDLQEVLDRAWPARP